MDSGLCDLVAAGHNKTSDISINGRSLHAEMKRILSPSNKGTEEYKKMVRASTKIYRDNWWEAILWGIYNSGVKSKLGMGVIARWMGLTGGFKNLCQKSLRAGLFYNNISNADEVVKLEPAVAGQDKEKDWIIAYNKNYSKKWGAWTDCANDFINAANTGNLDSPEFNAASQGVVIRYGEIVSGLASEAQDIIEILKTANGPEVLGSDTTGGINNMPAQGVAAAVENMSRVVPNNGNNSICYKMIHDLPEQNTSGFKLTLNNGNTYTPRWTRHLYNNICYTDCSGLAAWILLESGLFTAPFGGGKDNISSEISFDISQVNVIRSKLAPGYDIWEVPIAQRQKGDLLCSAGMKFKGKPSPLLNVSAARDSGSVDHGHCAICYDASHVVGIGSPGSKSLLTNFTPACYKVCYRIAKGKNTDQFKS